MIKYKIANFRTKLRGLGCHEVTINSLKNKAQNKAALNVKKPRKTEDNYFPEHPKGETTDTLENERIALLSEMTKRNNDHAVARKMEKTFSYRRQEVLQGQPLESRWSALFTQKEVNVSMSKSPSTQHSAVLSQPWLVSFISTSSVFILPLLYIVLFK